MFDLTCLYTVVTGGTRLFAIAICFPRGGSDIEEYSNIKYVANILAMTKL